MKSAPISRRHIVGAIILAALLFLIWFGFSPVMTRLFVPAFAASAGLEMTAESGRWSLLGGGMLEKVKFSSSRWSGEIANLQVIWTWQGLMPKPVYLEISDLRLRQRKPPEKRAAYRADVPEKRAQDKRYRIFSLLNQDTRLLISNAILEFGGNTRATVVIPVAQLKSSEFTASGKLSLGRVDEEQIGLDLQFAGRLSDIQTQSWEMTITAAVSVIPPPLIFLRGSSLSGLAKGVGWNLLEFDGEFEKQDSKLGTVSIAANSDAANGAGSCDFQLAAELRKLLALVPGGFSEFLPDEANQTAEISAKFSWSPDLAELAANFAAGEFSSGTMKAVRKPGSPWEFREAAAKFRFSGAGFLDINREESSADDESDRNRAGKFLAKFRLPQAPARMIKKFAPNMSLFELGGALTGTAEAMPDANFWSWRADLSGGAMSLERAALRWSIADWSLSASGRITEWTLSPETLKISAQDEFELALDVEENSPLSVTFKNVAFALNPTDAHQNGGILLRRGVVLYSAPSGLTYDIIGCDMPSTKGWIAPGAGRKTEDWSLRGNISLLPGQLTLTDTILLSPASCESCRLTLSGTFRYPDFFDIHLSGTGVDFTHFAHPSELALAAFNRQAHRRNPRQAAPEEHSEHPEKSTLKVEALDCLVPRLGRGDIKGTLLYEGETLALKDAVINLDVGGVACDATWSRSQAHWRLDKISGALKTIKLPALRSLLPTHFVPYLTGDLTLNGEFETDDSANLFGRGTAEWTGADISAVPAMKKLLNEAGEKISPELARLRLEAGRADFRLEGGNVFSDELMIYGDSGILEISGQYDTQTDEIDAGVVFHLSTDKLRRARVRIGGVTIAGQTLVTFGRQQDELTTLPGVLPVRGKLQGNLRADWNAWLEGLGIPSRLLKR